MASIRLERLAKRWAGGQVGLETLDLAIADGEFLVLVGPSGCGKSTALRLVAGLETPTSGRVWIGDRDATELPPGERDVAMVFQSYALYPHKSVRENLGFGLRVRGVPRAEREARIAAAAGRLGLEALLERRPAQLSGGQRQRVALGRALVREPQAFLLDEPLSNLDARLRLEMRVELKRLHRELGATIVYVTHDQEEALTLGDRVAVLRAGRIEQVGAPLEVYERPATAFVADFLGSPGANWLDAEVAAGDGGRALRAGPVALAAPRALEGVSRVRVAIRPHDVALVDAGAGDFDASIELVQPLGGTRLVHLAVASAGPALRLVAVEASAAPRGVGTRVGVRIQPGALQLFDPVTERRL